MLEFFFGWVKFFQESEEFVDLLFWEIRVIGGVLYFVGKDVLASSSHYVWEGVKAGVAYWNADSVITFFLQKFDENGFAVETSFAPAAKSYSVEFSTQGLEHPFAIL